MDRYSSVIKQGILREIKQINSSMPIKCIIYDESIIENDSLSNEQIASVERYVKSLKK